MAVDGNKDGVIDAADYTIWRDHLGSAGAIASTVPEPASAMLVTQMLIGGLLLCAPRRKA